MILVSPQLSQTAASIDNRVPTPSSVASAETNSQQPGPEVPLLEMKAEIKTEDTEPDAGEPKGEPGAAVGAFPGHGWMCCTRRRQHVSCFTTPLSYGSRAEEIRNRLVVYF